MAICISFQVAVFLSVQQQSGYIAYQDQPDFSNGSQDDGDHLPLLLLQLPVPRLRPVVCPGVALEAAYME